ncbi:MAG: pyridoxamine 5'-phosphate oxidase [Bacteroidota bacterium]|jgi:pyridoxamine 5'-phosphate oxidase|nr:pyridoxamine 5'-phosphate oxidase [Bacteroidota bacterium]
MSRISIADIRKDYILASLSEEVVGDDPFSFFHTWFEEAVSASIDDVNAMTLSTLQEDGFPDARIVLLKGLDERGFTFFTNYESEKGVQLSKHSKASLVFHWKELERQVRVMGVAEQLTAAENDAYFASRPRASQLGAWASPQSQKIEKRELLEERYAQFEQQFTDVVPRPAHWGGYRIVPIKIEFWHGRSSRMHDRIVFEKQENESWSRYRVAP